MFHPFVFYDRFQGRVWRGRVLPALQGDCLCAIYWESNHLYGVFAYARWNRKSDYRWVKIALASFPRSCLFPKSCESFINCNTIFIPSSSSFAVSFPPQSLPGTPAWCCVRGESPPKSGGLSSPCVSAGPAPPKETKKLFSKKKGLCIYNFWEWLKASCCCFPSRFEKWRETRLS